MKYFFIIIVVLFFSCTSQEEKFNYARDSYLKKDYVIALEQLKKFISSYNSGPYVNRARQMLIECQLINKAFKAYKVDSIDISDKYFKKLIKQYPQSVYYKDAIEYIKKIDRIRTITHEIDKAKLMKDIHKLADLYHDLNIIKPGYYGADTLESYYRDKSYKILKDFIFFYGYFKGYKISQTELFKKMYYDSDKSINNIFKKSYKPILNRIKNNFENLSSVAYTAPEEYNYIKKHYNTYLNFLKAARNSSFLDYLGYLELLANKFSLDSVEEKLLMSENAKLITKYKNLEQEFSKLSNE